MLQKLKAFKEKFIRAENLSDKQLNRRLFIFKTLSVYYGVKMLVGGALVAGGVITLGLGAAGIALPLPLWLGAGGLGLGALMLANGIISGGAFGKTYRTYAREKSARAPEGATAPATPSVVQGLKARFDASRKAAAALPAKIAAQLPRKPANDAAAAVKKNAQKRNTP